MSCHFFVFKCLNIFLMRPVTGRLLFAVLRDWNESSFSCSKKKTSRINNIVVFFCSVFWQNEWGWKVFSAHWLYYDMRGSYFIPRALLCLHVCGFCWSIKTLQWARTKLKMSIKIQRKTSQVIFPYLPTLTQSCHCHPLPNNHSQFLNSIKRLWKSWPTKNHRETHLVALKLFICRLLLFHFVKHITIYLNRVQDKHSYEENIKLA